VARREVERQYTDDAERQYTKDERLLCRLFKRFSGCATVKPDSDFFALGGSSFAAMVLAVAARQARRELPLDLLFKYRTPARVAAAWSACPAGAQTDRRPTLFMLPGLGGDNAGLAGLRADWAETMECVLLDYPDWAVLAAPGFEMDDLITDIIGRMRQRGPPRKLFVAGYSLGGFVAWAVARELAKTATPVDAVFIFDADMRETIPTIVRDPFFVRCRRILRNITAVVRAGDTNQMAKLAAEFVGYRLGTRPGLLLWLTRWRTFRLPTSFRYWLHFALGSQFQANVVRRWQLNDPAAQDMLGGTDVFVFRVATQTTEEEASLGWQSRCARLSIVAAPGDHLSLLVQRGPGSLHDIMARKLAELQ